MSIKPVSGKIQSQELNDNFSYLDSNKRGKDELVGMSGLTQEVKENMTGGSVAVVGNKSVGTNSIKSGSVTEEETTFIEVSSNIFNKNDVIPRKTINDNGDLIDSTALCVSHNIPVVPGETLTWNGNNNQYIRAFYDEGGNFISVHKQVVTSFIAPENAYILKVVVFIGNLDLIQINRGNTLLSYEPFKRLLDDKLIADKSITSNKTTDLGTLGVINLSSPFVAPNIDTSNKKLIFTKGFNIKYKNIRYAFSGTGAVEVELDKNASYQYIYFNSSTQEIRVIIPTKENLIKESEILIMVLQFKQAASNLFSVYSTVEVTVDGLRWNKYLDNLYDDGNSDVSKFKIASKVPNIFYKTTSKPNAQGTGNADFNYETTKAQDIYDKFDELMDEYPNYITRKFLGNDQSGALPIYQYTFKAERPRSVGPAPTLLKYPKILLTCGVHGNNDTTSGDLTTGDPHMHIFSLYYFFEDLCRNWEGNEAIEYLRWNVDFAVIPIANPYGMNNHQRTNSRNVDINRNMDYGWQNESNSHKGNAPFSEKESQIIRDFINDNKSDNVIFHNDYHCIGGPEFVYDDNLIRHLVTPGSSMYNTTEEAIKYVSRNWLKNGIEFSIDSKSIYYANFGFTNVFNATPMVYQWVDKVAGIPSITTEAFRQTRKQSQDGKGQFNDQAVEMNIENLANWIMIALRYFTE